MRLIRDDAREAASALPPSRNRVPRPSNRLIAQQLDKNKRYNYVIVSIVNGAESRQERRDASWTTVHLRPVNVARTGADMDIIIIPCNRSSRGTEAALRPPFSSFCGLSRVLSRSTSSVPTGSILPRCSSKVPIPFLAQRPLIRKTMMRAKSSTSRDRCLNKTRTPSPSLTPPLSVLTHPSTLDSHPALGFSFRVHEFVPCTSFHPPSLSPRRSFRFS
ncbi:hypothetical protein PENSPDRAFT_460885 [Peniophora sp. CONT]|nr:hypothetical protein PENSPDRAFT_460885 [Peniophora sp. CONT]